MKSSTHNHSENVEMTSADNLPEGNEKALLQAAQLTHMSFVDLVDCENS
jgi:hypothetical protein